MMNRLTTKRGRVLAMGGAGLAVAALSLAGPVASASAAGANQSGPYDPSGVGAPSQNGNGNGNAYGKPAAGTVGNADAKNPPGQLPNARNDGNKGYECDANSGVGVGNPAHSGCGGGEGST
jgi:hypothetical protein